MDFGSTTIKAFNFGFFRLDGGAMFGSVPKNLWSKRIPADEENCIRLATRSMLIIQGDKKIIIDCGMGEKWNEKQIAIYAIKNTPESEWPFKRESITDLILTHLHFDHAGGISRYDSEGKLQLSFPNAQLYLQKSNWENAKSPSLKERASYLPENVNILESSKLKLVTGKTEVLPGFFVHQVDGHTVGQQWVEIRVGKEVIMYTTDLIPTSHHLPLPYHMGYDACAATLLGEKKAFLERAVSENAIVFFEHDPDIAAARVHIDSKGHYAVKEVVNL